MTPELRAKMGAAAVAAARAIGYVGAGTVEFLLDQDGSFYFMEMNTRLQVEHPVTEMITGQDLVEWQLRVASGEPLPCRQEELTINGHAIEARIYAEDPARDFFPSIGTLFHLRTPAESTHVRIDTGVRQGDEVSINYDPMIAKLIVWDTDRTGALRRLQQALAEYQVVGVTTNTGFLGAVAAHPAFAEANLDTGFIERNREGLFPEIQPASDKVLALACLDVLLRRDAEAKKYAASSTDPYSPWHLTHGWRPNSDNHHVLYFIDGDATTTVTAHYRKSCFLLELPGGSVLARGEIDKTGNLVADLDGMRTTATVVRHDADLTIITTSCTHRLTMFDPSAQTAEREGEGGSLNAPMPGKIIAVMTEVGAQVKRGMPLLIMEAMKMEHTITAPVDGVVATVNYVVGTVVNDGAVLLSLVPEEAA
jgi:3-methylcrotonyl-CoA carboxylase alpha subunit